MSVRKLITVLLFALLAVSVYSCGEDTEVSDGDIDTFDNDINENGIEQETESEDGDLETELESETGEEDIDRDEDEESGCLVPDGDPDVDPDVDADLDQETVENDSSEIDETESSEELDGDTEDELDNELAPEEETEPEQEAEEEVAPCPADMVLAKRADETMFCIDRYEASRQDASPASQGTDNSIAKSVAGVIPWYVKPINAENFGLFKVACTAAGKRICHTSEWQDACKGEESTPYVYGSAFDREACNCVATFCDDYCTDLGIPMEECNLNEGNCGYYCGSTVKSKVSECMTVVETGHFDTCTNSFGHFDINGNVWEVVESDTDGRGYEVRGGAYNCASPSSRVNCNYNASWTSLYAGFRCCKDIPIK